MSPYIYKSTAAGFTVGCYITNTNGQQKWWSESDHPNEDKARERINYLNGGPRDPLVVQAALACAMQLDALANQMAAAGRWHEQPQTIDLVLPPGILAAVKAWKAAAR